MWGSQLIVATIPAFSVFLESCLGIRAHLYSLNSFSSDRLGTHSFAQSLSGLWAGTWMSQTTHVGHTES